MRKELLKGITDTMVLKILEKEKMYGYLIIKTLSDYSNGYFEFKKGTMYPILHKLESKNYIKSYWDNTNSVRKRKYYLITEEGKKELEKQSEEWERFSININQVLDL